MDAHSSSSGARPDTPEPKETSKTGAATQELSPGRWLGGGEVSGDARSCLDDGKDGEVDGILRWLRGLPPVHQNRR